MVLGNINIHVQNPDFLFMVEYAIKAPSGHNTQPWLFRINENNIEIHPNFDRALPVVDFDNRELFISLGCALENLCITALEKGYDYDVELTKTGIITVYLSSPDTSGYNSLFQQIPLRQTNRSIYNGKQIPEENIDILLHAGDSYAIPGNTPHSFEVIEGGEVVDVFTPQREDYL